MVVWQRAREAAGSLLPADLWRKQLAASIHETGVAAVVGIFTCHPNRPHAAQGTLAPADLPARIGDRVLAGFQAHLGRASLASGQAKARGCAAFALAPSEAAGSESAEADALGKLVALVSARGLVGAQRL